MITFKVLEGCNQNRIPYWEDGLHDDRVDGSTILDLGYYKENGLKIVKRKENICLVRYKGGNGKFVQLWFKKKLINDEKIYIFKGREYI